MLSTPTNKCFLDLGEVVVVVQTSFQLSVISFQLAACEVKVTHKILVQDCLSGKTEEMSRWMRADTRRLETED